MRQILGILSLVLLVFFTGCSNPEVSQTAPIQVSTIQETKVGLTPTQDNFLKVLATNKDGKEYLDKYPNTKLVNFKKITPNEFETLKNQSQYKELYTDLPNKNVYLVDFNGGSSLSLTTVIDLEEEKVVKIFGIYIMGMG